MKKTVRTREMKRPKWTDEGLTAPIIQGQALDRVASALRIEARFFRKIKNMDAAYALEWVEKRIKEVSNGKTWAQAFEWPPIDGGKEL